MTTINDTTNVTDATELQLISAEDQNQAQQTLLQLAAALQTLTHESGEADTCTCTSSQATESEEATAPAEDVSGADTTTVNSSDDSQQSKNNAVVEMLLMMGNLLVEQSDSGQKKLQLDGEIGQANVDNAKAQAKKAQDSYQKYLKEQKKQKKWGIFGKVLGAFAVAVSFAVGGPAMGTIALTMFVGEETGGTQKLTDAISDKLGIGDLAASIGLSVAIAVLTAVVCPAAAVEEAENMAVDEIAEGATSKIAAAAKKVASFLGDHPKVFMALQNGVQTLNDTGFPRAIASAEMGVKCYSKATDEEKEQIDKKAQSIAVAFMVIGLLTSVAGGVSITSSAAKSAEGVGQVDSVLEGGMFDRLAGGSFDNALTGVYNSDIVTTIRTAVRGVTSTDDFQTFLRAMTKALAVGGAIQSIGENTTMIEAAKSQKDVQIDQAFIDLINILSEMMNNQVDTDQQSTQQQISNSQIGSNTVSGMLQGEAALANLIVSHSSV